MKLMVRILVALVMLAVLAYATDRSNRWASFGHGRGEEVLANRSAATLSAPLIGGFRFLNLANPLPFSEANGLFLVGCALVFLGMLSPKKPHSRDSDKTEI